MMCVEPTRVESPVKSGRWEYVACRNCWQCRENRLSDLVGRMLCEDRYSTASLFATLTYREGTPNSVVLCYRDIQLMLKRLRYFGYSVRYFVAGEYGERKGRAHWHVIFFFNGKVPDVPFHKNCEWEFWEHGFSFFRPASAGAFSYACEYVSRQKDEIVGEKRVMMSKRPLLGAEFIRDLARQHVAQGLAPQSPEVVLGWARDFKGRLRRLWLSGASLRLFIEEYTRLWAAVHPGVEIPWSPVLEDEWDRVARAEYVEADEHWHMRKHSVFDRPTIGQSLPEAGGAKVPPAVVLAYLALPNSMGILVQFLSSGDVLVSGPDVNGDCEWLARNAKDLWLILKAQGLTWPQHLSVLGWWQQKFDQIMNGSGPIAAV